MPEPRTCGANCPHHYHNHPKVHITEHDACRMEVSAALIQIAASMMAMAVEHRGHFGDLLDMLPTIGKALDQMRVESPELVMYLANQTDSQENAMRHQAELARRGDVQTLVRYSNELERANPLPIVEVSG